MKQIDDDFLFTVSSKQIESIIINKRGLYPIHSYELVVLLQKYINDFSVAPVSFIKPIDSFFILRNAQIERKPNYDSSIYNKPLVNYYHVTKVMHMRNELLR
jgi:hypothetical protein